jgi:hypothetical protein
LVDFGPVFCFGVSAVRRKVVQQSHDWGGENVESGSQQENDWVSYALRIKSVIVLLFPMPQIGQDEIFV